MQLHGNAKLGLSGRQALVRAIEEGQSLKAARPPSACRRRRRIAGGIGGWREGGGEPRCWIGRRGLCALRGS
jgi:hypothetical protein